MTEIILFLIAFIGLILLVAWLPFFKANKNQGNDSANLSSTSLRDETNVTLYHEHKAEIEKDFAEGGIDEENYHYLLAELDKSLLQDIEDNKTPDVDANAGSTISPLWPVAITVFVVGFSALMYSKSGAYQEIASTPRMSQSDAHQELDDEQQMIVRLKELKQRTEENPEDSDAWYGMGQMLISVGQFDAAVVAFDQVIRIEGELADLVGAKAQAYYYKNEQQIDEQVQTLIDRALALDPLDPATHILLGMHTFMNQDYATAIEHWQKVVDSNRPGTNKQALEEAIAEAKNRMTMTGEAEKAATGPQLQVAVSVSDSIFSELSHGEDKVVFVYAVPTEGQRVPVAAIKIQASDLPTTVVLNDALAMTPENKLSQFDLVHLYAVISNSGAAGIKSGDFKAERLGVAVVRAEPVELVIDSIVQ